jgi:Flp pilus assembly pilin Flp
MKNIVSKLSSNEDGQGLIEYAFILIFIALSVVIALPPLGASLVAKFESINGALN